MQRAFLDGQKQRQAGRRLIHLHGAGEISRCRVEAHFAKRAAARACVKASQCRTTRIGPPHHTWLRPSTPSK